MRKHRFTKMGQIRRCIHCGLEYAPKDNSEIVASYEMSSCPGGIFNPQRAVPITACIGLDRPWIQCGESSIIDDPRYYRDYTDKDGNLCYCDGEVCLVHPWSNPEQHPDTVLMSNEESTIPYFIISKEQFFADFGEETGAKALATLYGSGKD